MVFIEVGMREGEINLCNLYPKGECQDCPYLTCNNHPQFALVQKCVERWLDEQRRRPPVNR